VYVPRAIGQESYAPELIPSFKISIVDFLSESGISIPLWAEPNLIWTLDGDLSAQV
jgi:hypothetical protein